VNKLATGLTHLTPVEIRVASLIKEGKTNKEIAEVLLVSKNTILFHRYNIRNKLGLKNQKINLRSHLLALK
jgi:DNA-binding CsgD family transcriptional regulator